MNRYLAIATLTLLTGIGYAQQQVEPTAEPMEAESAALAVGSDAPAIKATNWVKGKEVKEFEKGKGYVVEFWATWCGPCIESIPHLTQLQRKYRNVAFVGMAASERKPASGSDNRLKVLENFVRAKGAKMNYTVAYDADGLMFRDWVTASGRGGIPCAFVIDTEGKIAFVGHPASEDFEAKVKEVSEAVKKAAAAAKAEKSKSKKSTKEAEKPAESNPESESPTDAEPAPAEPK